MKQFEYTINNDQGIHARPAGLLVKFAKGFESNITLIKQGISVDAKKLMAILGLGITKGATVTVRAEGNDESEALEVIEQFFKKLL